VSGLTLLFRLDIFAPREAGNNFFAEKPPKRKFAASSEEWAGRVLPMEKDGNS
jgi:hypothetical protein